MIFTRRLTDVEALELLYGDARESIIKDLFPVSEDMIQEIIKKAVAERLKAN